MRLAETANFAIEQTSKALSFFQLGHTCVVLMRRAIWSIDPTVFEPQYDLQVQL